MFATEDGTISAWSGGPAATLTVDSSGASAVYKGLAIAGTGANARIYATNFNSRKVEAFDSNFTPILPGGFADPTLPAGYAPFGIQSTRGIAIRWGDAAACCRSRCFQGGSVNS